MKNAKIALTALIVVCFSALGQADPLCTVGTVADYIAVGSCQIGDKLFYDFGYTGTGVGGAPAIMADSIAVTPITTPFNPGLIFGAAWNVGPGQLLDSNIHYTVLVLPGGNPITDISATMAGGAQGDGVVVVNESATVGDLILFTSEFGTKAFDVLAVPATAGPITVVTDIAVDGGISGGATASEIRNQFSETAPVPEPTSMLLLGSGLVGAAGAVRKKLLP